LSPIFYREKGEGQPVVLIHGFCETHAIWNTIFDQLALDYHVIAIDLPGFGNSVPPSAPLTIDTVAEQVLVLLHEELKLTNSVLLGHSLGGYVALAMVDKSPKWFAGIGLIHATAYADSAERKLSRNKVIEFINKHGVNLYVRSFIPSLFSSQSNPYISTVLELASETPHQTVINYALAMRDRPGRIDVLKTFSKPVLLLAGRLDCLIPVTALEDQAAQLLHSKLIILENVSHMCMLENEKDTLLAIRNFLTSTG